MTITTLFSLAGKTALITGAAGGLGKAISATLADAGARLVLTDRSQAMVDAALDEAGVKGAKAVGYVCDMGNISDVRRFVDDLVRDGQIPDVLVLNAGMQGPAGPSSQVSEDDWHKVLTVNLQSTHLILSQLSPLMAGRGSGSVILMSSIAGLRGNHAIGLYGLTKAALSQMARNMAVEWGPSGLRFNAVAPGLIRTPLAAGLLANEIFMAKRLAATPLRRAGEPHEIAGVVLMLASDAGGFVTGQTLVVDGGTLISDGF